MLNTILSYKFLALYENNGIHLPNLLMKIKNFSDHFQLVIKKNGIYFIIKSWKYHFEAFISKNRCITYNLMSDDITINIDSHDLYKKISGYKAKNCSFNIGITDENLIIECEHPRKRGKQQIKVAILPPPMSKDFDDSIPKKAILLSVNGQEILDFLITITDFKIDRFIMDYDFNNNNLILATDYSKNSCNIETIWEIPAPHLKTKTLNKNLVKSVYLTNTLKKLLSIIQKLPNKDIKISFKKFGLLQVRIDVKYDCYIYFMINSPICFKEIWGDFWNIFIKILINGHKAYSVTKLKNSFRNISNFLNYCNNMPSYWVKNKNYIDSFINPETKFREILKAKKDNNKIDNNKNNTYQIDFFGNRVLLSNKKRRKKIQKKDKIIFKSWF